MLLGFAWITCHTWVPFTIVQAFDEQATLMSQGEVVGEVDQGGR